MNARVLTLPRLCGTRWAARNLIQEQLQETERRDVIAIDCAALQACSGGYVDELIRELCEERDCIVRLEGVDHDAAVDFLEFFDRQVEARGMESQVVSR